MAEPSSCSLDVRPETPSSLLVIRRGSNELRFHATSLERGLGELLAELARELFTHDELALGFVELARGCELVQGAGVALSELARASSSELVTQLVLNACLSGPSGFERAAIYLYDRAQGAYLLAGARERDEVPEPPPSTAGPMSKRFAPRGSASVFQESAKSLVLKPKGGEADELGLALRGERSVFDRSLSGPDPLGALGPRARFALLASPQRTPPIALLFGDGEEPSLGDERIALLAELLAQASLAWDNLRLRREVEDLARTDPETGLYNRRELELRFSQERSRAQRATAPLSLLVLGVSDDAEAPVAAAEARALAGVLRDELRAVDIAARFDAGALAALLPGAGSLEAALVARRVGVTAHRRGIAPSVGVASYPDDCDHPDDLVALAQQNLAAARTKGPGHAALSGDDSPIVFAEEADEEA
jgi:diguanylate cyclase (GGDEF)-like protein